MPPESHSQASAPATAPASSTAGTASAHSAARQMLAGWIVSDPLSRRLAHEIQRIASSTSTVLIRGESGSGKDLLASVLHYLGPHAEEPLVKIDCATLPLELMESELFGYERGAFTGATHRKRGRLELAGSGTLVLDEISALSLPMQAKLLRVLEERRFERLGGTRSLEVAARIVALTSANLEQAVARRGFREDLYYRLSVIPVSIPPLRERPGDIPPLAERFLAQLSEAHRKPRLTFAAGVLPILQAYPFPGNVRELRNILEQAVLSAAPPVVRVGDLPQRVRQAASHGTGTKLTLAEMERAYIAEVLDFTRGKKGRAAEILGISRKTLLEKRRRYNL